MGPFQLHRASNSTPPTTGKALGSALAELTACPGDGASVLAQLLLVISATEMAKPRQV